MVYLSPGKIITRRIRTNTDICPALTGTEIHVFKSRGHYIYQRYTGMQVHVYKAMGHNINGVQSIHVLHLQADVQIRILQEIFSFSRHNLESS